MYKKFSILLLILAMIMVGSKVAYSSESWIGADGKVQTDYGDPTEIVGQPNQIPTKMERTSIVVDGDPSDWVGIAPLITDPLGDYSPGLDFINLSVTDDGTYVYFLYEFDSAPGDCSHLMLDTDQNPTTGCAAYGMGFEYGITFCPGWGGGYIGDARDCGWWDDFSGALIWAFANQYIEAAVPISTLEILTPELTEFDITTANDTSYVATYVLGAAPDWQTAYNTLFDSPSDLELLRQYRDEILSKTTKGKRYKTLLYLSSEEALEVLLDNPELILEAKDLIEANKDAVSEVLNGNEDVIYNTDGIICFLDAYAKKSPPVLKILANMVKRDMLRKQRQGKLFLGFELR